MASTAARGPINIRIAEAERDRIDAAARASGATRSAFILAAALDRADEVLLDRVRFNWSDAALRAFQAALADPPAPAPRAVAAMNKPKPWR